jgi:hypothetical protein
VVGLETLGHARGDGLDAVAVWQNWLKNRDESVWAKTPIRGRIIACRQVELAREGRSG